MQRAGKPGFCVSTRVGNSCDNLQRIRHWVGRRAVMGEVSESSRYARNIRSDVADFVGLSWESRAPGYSGCESVESLCQPLARSY